MTETAQRLAAALKCRALTVEGFAKKMGEEHRRLEARFPGSGFPGHSYRSVFDYLKGRTEPSRAFLKAAARVLRVRYAWLDAGEGEMTESQVVIAEATAVHATHEAVMMIHRRRAGAAPPVIDAPATAAYLAMLAPELAKSPVAKPVLAEAWDRYVAGSPTPPDAARTLELVKDLWALVEAPLKLRGMRTEWTDRTRTDYYVAMLHALTLAMPEPGKGVNLARRSRHAAQAKAPAK